MSDDSLVFQTRAGPRALGVFVLVGCVVGGIYLASTGGAPIVTWVLLALFGVAAAVATVSNFGDRLHVDEFGLRSHNVLTARVGMPRERRAPWSDVLRASSYEGRTWFVTVHDQPRWVLDQLDAHDRLREIFETKGVSIHEITKPRAFGRGRGLEQ